MANAALSVRSSRLVPVNHSPFPLRPYETSSPSYVKSVKNDLWKSVSSTSQERRGVGMVRGAGSRADDSSTPFEMSVDSALKLLGVADDASFEDILRAKNTILATCADDQDAVAQVEAAYDMLLMQRLSQRRAGKVASSNIRYADVKTVSGPSSGTMPQWFQTSLKSSPISLDQPSTRDIGVQAGVYGAMMVLTYLNGTTSAASVPYSGADVPGLVLATSFGASLYFMTKKNVKLGKAALITAGGLVTGAVVGSAVEGWLQVDIVPFLGLHSPASVISEFILFVQLLVSLYLR